MADSRSRVVSALNHLTGEGISYYPDGCDHSAIEALIQDYFDDGSDEIDDDVSTTNEGKPNIFINQHYTFYFLRTTRYNRSQQQLEKEGQCTQLVLQSLQHFYIHRY